MAEPKTYDRRWKWEHLVDLVERLLERFNKSKMALAFRVGFVWFSDDVKRVTMDGRSYFETAPENRALQAFRASLEENQPYGMTAMADALEEAAKIVEEYIEDTSLPSEKYVSIFLFTDGKETKKTPDDVAAVAQR
ncbi:MAG: VWA domain-containing protein, partial [Crenarchaeota archaeon]|nr:VWA domain-containing protein [Thermoproteota archaeon]